MRQPSDIPRKDQAPRPEQCKANCSLTSGARCRRAEFPKRVSARVSMLFAFCVDLEHHRTERYGIGAFLTCSSCWEDTLSGSVPPELRYVCYSHNSKLAYPGNRRKYELRHRSGSRIKHNETSPRSAGGQGFLSSPSPRPRDVVCWDRRDSETNWGINIRFYYVDLRILLSEVGRPLNSTPPTFVCR